MAKPKGKIPSRRDSASVGCEPVAKALAANKTIMAEFRRDAQAANRADQKALASIRDRGLLNSIRDWLT